ncbi:MAG: VWA domain-containing protein [Acidobacteriota bacterium]|nr:VWA domain-containing protein [Acidobacteriota bacterium]
MSGRFRQPLRRLGTLAAWLGVVTAPLAAQRNYSESADVVAVEIPVQVVREGEPVRGLTAKDFVVYEGRKEQPVVGFDVEDLSGTGAGPSGQAPAVPIPASARRHFLLLFDLSFSEPASIVKARDVAKNLVGKSLHPSDLVAVATYSSAYGPQLVLGFSPDRRQIASAIDHLGLPQLVDRSPDPLRLVAAEASAAQATATPGGGRSGAAGSGRQTVAEELQLLAAKSESANRTAQTAAVTGLTRALGDLAKLMASVEGRKQVVYLSEGFDSSLLLGTTDQNAMNQMNQASLEGRVQDIDSDVRFGNTKATNRVEKMLEEFRRADCTIQAVDIGGLRAGANQGAQRPSGEDAMFQMAHDTGGELYRNFNDLGEAMGQMLRKTSFTYVLTIQPEKLKRDGGYHHLRVELRNAHGARVVARPGYYAPKPFNQLSPVEKLLSAANEVMGGTRSGSVDAAVLAAPFELGGAKAYVPVVIEIGGPSFLAGGTGTTLPAEIYVYALDAGGAIQDFLTQTVGLDLKKVEPALRQSGLKFFGHLELAPGVYSLRVLVRNGTSGVYSAQVLPLTVPAFAQPQPVLLPPFFPEPRGKWVMIREAPRGEQQKAPYPFMVQQAPYIPAGSPTLVPGQETAVALVLYHWAAGDLTAAARVFAPDGREVGPGEIKLGARDGASGNEADHVQASLRLPPALPPGDYRLVVTLTDAHGAAQASSAPFHVGAPRGAHG